MEYWQILGNFLWNRNVMYVAHVWNMAPPGTSVIHFASISKMILHLPATNWIASGIPCRRALSALRYSNAYASTDINVCVLLCARRTGTNSYCWCIDRHSLTHRRETQHYFIIASILYRSSCTRGGAKSIFMRSVMLIESLLTPMDTDLSGNLSLHREHFT